MRIRASIFTILVVMLFAANAFAVPSTSLQKNADFIGWDDSTSFGSSGEAAALWLTFDSNWTVDGSLTANNTGGGSMYATSSSSTITFDNGADEFYFTYTSPTYVTITLATNIFDTSDPFFDPGTYASAFWGDVTIAGYTSNTITYYLSGSTTEDPSNPGEYLDGRFAFYCNDGDEYLSIVSLTFTTYDPTGNLTETTNTVELTNLHYNPTTPIPGAAWLLGSGLIGLVGLRRFRG